MESLNLKDFFSKLSIGMKIDDSIEFLKAYDKNKNSIFDAEDIESIKKDLEKADKTDKNIGKISDNDLLKLYQLAMKKLKIKNDSSKTPGEIENIKQWMRVVNAGKTDVIIKLKNSDAYPHLSPELRNFAEEILLFDDNIDMTSMLFNLLKCRDKVKPECIDLFKNFTTEFKSPTILGENNTYEYIELSTCSREEYEKIKPYLGISGMQLEISVRDLKKLAERVPEDKIEDAKALLQTKINIKGKESYLNIDLIPEMLNLEKEQLNQVYRLFELGVFKKDSPIEHILKLSSISQHINDQKLLEIESFVFAPRGDSFGFRRQGLKHIYRPEKGLIELRVMSPWGDFDNIYNLEQNTKTLIRYSADANNTNARSLEALSEEIKKYDNITYNEKRGKFETGNLLETITIESGDIVSIPNITSTNKSKPLQTGEILSDGTKIITRNFTSIDGTRYENYYREEPNGSYENFLKITDKEGNVLRDSSQKHTKISENVYMTEINGKRYKAVYSDTTLTITDETNNITKIFDISENFISEGREEVISALKKVPANLLLAMDDLSISGISYTTLPEEDVANNAHWDIASKEIIIGESVYLNDYRFSNKKELSDTEILSAFLHEYGHFLDTDENSILQKISNNENFLKVYNEEVEEFMKNSSVLEQENIAYFTNEKDKDGIEGHRSYQEMTAECIKILYCADAGPMTSRRSRYLMEHFPRTIATIGEILDKQLDIYLAD